MTCPTPTTIIRIDLLHVLRRMAHGVRHMRGGDLAIRVALALGCLAVSAWMITTGAAAAWPLFLGVVGAASVALDAAELYAVGAVCDRLAEELEER